jgi:predicted Rossmann fold flavoprotein
MREAVQPPYRIAVIGGGPSGLFAAIRYAEQASGSTVRTRIVVLERRSHPCRKLLVAGSGQCNLTHAGPIEDFAKHYGGGAKPGAVARFLKSSLLEFSNTDLLDWFRARGLDFEEEEGGKVFPVTRKSSSVLDILLSEATRLGVEILGERRVLSLAVADGAFVIGTSHESITAGSVLISTGGASYPVTGSSGDGYALAAALGHTIVSPRPALAPVYIEDFRFGSVAGLSFKDAGLTVRRGGKKLSSRVGDILITHKGVSGPLVLDASRGIKPGDRLEVRFADIDLDAFRERLDGHLAAAPRRLVKTVLADCGLPRSLSELFCKLAGLAESAIAADLKRSVRETLCTLACACPMHVTALGDLDEAMATAGGIDLAEVNPRTMESRLVPGLFFAGEVLDVDGDTGGYNLQAAFSTGALAAKGLAVNVKQRNFV